MPASMPKTNIMRSLPLAAILLLSTLSGQARDLGQWGNSDPQISAWYKRQMMPDNPYQSCCGEADAYWADQFGQTDKGEFIAVITDDRPDEPLHRPHVPIGTKIVVPKEKLKLGGDPNPTGHGIIFMNYVNHLVYCYLPPAGL